MSHRPSCNKIVTKCELQTLVENLYNERETKSTLGQLDKVYIQEYTDLLKQSFRPTRDTYKLEDSIELWLLVIFMETCWRYYQYYI